MSPIHRVLAGKTPKEVQKLCGLIRLFAGSLAVEEPADSMRLCEAMFSFFTQLREWPRDMATIAAHNAAIYCASVSGYTQRLEMPTFNDLEMSDRDMMYGVNLGCSQEDVQEHNKQGYSAGMSNEQPKNTGPQEDTREDDPTEAPAGVNGEQLEDGDANTRYQARINDFRLKVRPPELALSRAVDIEKAKVEVLSFYDALLNNYCQASTNPAERTQSYVEPKTAVQVTNAVFVELFGLAAVQRLSGLKKLQTTTNKFNPDRSLIIKTERLANEHYLPQSLAHLFRLIATTAANYEVKGTGLEPLVHVIHGVQIREELSPLGHLANESDTELSAFLVAENDSKSSGQSMQKQLERYLQKALNLQGKTAQLQAFRKYDFPYTLAKSFDSKGILALLPLAKSAE